MSDSGDCGFGNDYSFLEDAHSKNQPDAHVSIVIPVYNRIEMLRRTIGMLTHSTYPLELIEVVIADDGSSDNPEQLVNEFSQFFEVNYVKQIDEGYQLSRVRNLGIRSARHDYIIILDCDMAPVPSLVEDQMKWMTLNRKVITLGHRRYVDANDIEISSVMESPQCMLDLPSVITKNKVMGNSPAVDWRESIYEETDMLKQSTEPFRVSSCGNVGFHRSVMNDAGWFDEKFTAWGSEDNEWGYRVMNQGFWFIPVLSAIGLHQEPPGGREFVDREAGKEITRPMRIDMVPDMYRTYTPGDCNSVPRIHCLVISRNNEQTIAKSIDSLLEQNYTDMRVVIVDYGSTDNTISIIRDSYLKEDRVDFYDKSELKYHEAMKFGVSKCSAPLIAVVHPEVSLSDDMINDSLSEMMDKKYLGNVGMLYGISKQAIAPPPNGEILNDFMEEDVNFRSFFYVIRKRDWARLKNIPENDRPSYDVALLREFEEVSETKESKFANLFSTLYQSVNPRVSVVIITRDRSELLQDSIKSVLHQTMKHFELIIVDDGSQDNTAEIVESFSDNRIRYFARPALGIPFARNFATQFARAEWIVIMDDDDLMLPNRLEVQLAAATVDCGGTYGGWIDYHIDSGELDYFPGKQHSFESILFSGKVLIHPAMMIRRKLLEEFPYDERFKYGTDWLMNMSVVSSGVQFRHCGQYIIVRRMHGKNVTTTDTDEQKTTARIMQSTILDDLGPTNTTRMRKVGKASAPMNTIWEPPIEVLNSKFSWLPLELDEVVEIKATQTESEQGYNPNLRWRQNGNRLTFDAITREIFFEMPDGWSMEGTHRDLFQLAHFVLTSPWEKDVMSDWNPTRKAGWRPGLSFSGGIDSAACAHLLPPETMLFYHEREGFETKLRHENAKFFIEQLKESGRHVVVTKSDHELIRTDFGKGAGFSTDFAAAVHVILLADMYELDSLSVGMPLENAYFYHGYRGRDFAESWFWKTHSKMFKDCGLDLLLPAIGLSEVITYKIVEEAGWLNLAQSCLRSKIVGDSCGMCWKCFRKNSMKGEAVKISGEIESFLGKEPLKQMVSTLYSLQRLPKSQIDEITKKFPHILRYIDLPLELLNRYIPDSFDMCPEQYRDGIIQKLNDVSEPMTEKEVNWVKTVDLTNI